MKHNMKQVSLFYCHVFHVHQCTKNSKALLKLLLFTMDGCLNINDQRVYVYTLYMIIKEFKRYFAITSRYVVLFKADL